MRLVIATKNRHKVRELRAYLTKFKNCDLFSLLDFPSYLPPEETGTTFEENAIYKATHAAKHLGVYALSDDSGLVVPALNGAPGIFSARFSGEHASDKDNRTKLLREMQNLEGIERSAYFTCVLALARPDGSLMRCVTGLCEGVIAYEDRGREGFGYDTLFIKHGYHQTFGELDENIKNRISHRAKAMSKMLLYFESC